MTHRTHRPMPAILTTATLLLTAALAGCTTTGEAAPDFAVTDSTGRPVSLSDFDGKPVVLFFASVNGCVSCTILTKNELVPLRADLGDDVGFVTFSIVPNWETDDDLEVFKADTGADWSHARDTNGIAQAYGVRSLSTVVVLDADHVVTLNAWEPNRERIEEALA